jgi:hypothetical protein
VIKAMTIGVIAGAAGTLALDVVPHLAYGLVVARTFDALT